MAEIKWIKLSVDMFDNRKIKYIRKLPDGDKIALIWVMLLTMAGRCNSNGMIFLTEDIPYTSKMLADELSFEESVIILAIEALQKLGMISIVNGVLCIDGWLEHQNIDGLERVREQTRKRVAEYRKRKANDNLLLCNVTSNNTVTESNGTEEEKEIDKEKDIHSFILSSDENEKKLEYLRGELGQGLVFISENQFEDLCDKLSLDELTKYLKIIADCEKEGKHYKKKSHYQAILEMVKRDRRLTNEK